MPTATEALATWLRPLTAAASLLCIGFCLISTKVAGEQPRSVVPPVHVETPPPTTPALHRNVAGLDPRTQLLSSPAGQTLYSIGEPTDEEQLYLELINRARANPAAEAERIQRSTDPEVLRNVRAWSVDLTLMVSQMAVISPALPLSMNPLLTAAARLHSQDMLANAFQGHEGTDGSTFGSRAQAQGYVWSTIAENVFAGATSPDEGHTAFEIDWGGDASTGGMQNPPGHRLNIHDPDFKEIGVGVVNGSNGKVGPQVVTQDFGSRQGITPFITGVAYYDLNGNGFYDAGEGIGGVRVAAQGSTFYAVSAGSGGYSLPVPQDGAYAVTFSVPGLADTLSDVVVSGGQSVKLDHMLVYAPPNISGPDKPAVNQDNRYSFSTVGGATSYQWKHARVIPASVSEGAEEGLTHFTVTSSPGYSVIDPTVQASGQSSFHLAQPVPEDQILALNGTFRAGPAAELSFASRLSWATSNQVARAEISVDAGKTWQDLWSQPGTGDAGEDGFTTRLLPLSTYASQEFTVRFVYAYLGGSFFPQTDSGVGLYVDDIAINGVDEVLDETLADVVAGAFFTFSPTTTDTYLLSVRPKVSARYLAWGSAKEVTAEVGEGSTTQLRINSVERLRDGRLQIDFSVVNPDSSVFQVQGAPDPAGPWSIETAASVESTPGGPAFRALVPAATDPSRFYRIVAPF